jgi:hypothetical protein
MKLKALAGAAVATGLLTMAAGLPAAQAQAMHHGDNGNAWVWRNGERVWSPRANIIHSERYARMVATDPAFRRQRIRIECGPITDPVLYQRCIGSFRHEVQAWNDGHTQATYRTALNDLNGDDYASSTPATYPTAGQ